MNYKQVLWDKHMNPVMCSFDSNVSLWVKASKNCTDGCRVFLSCCAPCCVCMQAPTHQGPEVSLVLTVQGLWLTCTDPAVRIRLWATTSVLLALSLALGLAPASQWVLKSRMFFCWVWRHLELSCLFFVRILLSSHLTHYCTCNALSLSNTYYSTLYISNL